MNPTTMVTPMTLYRNRPNYCWWGYHATPVCQVPPDAGCGYCVCSVCPAGYTSAGGRSIATSMCVPKTAPTNVRSVAAYGFRMPPEAVVPPVLRLPCLHVGAVQCIVLQLAF
jgi:hypothetical protein